MIGHDHKCVQNVKLAMGLTVIQCADSSSREETRLAPRVQSWPGSGLWELAQAKASG